MPCLSSDEDGHTDDGDADGGDSEDEALQTNSKYTLGVLKLYHGCIGGVNGVSLLQLEGVYKVYTDVLRVYCCADIFGCTEGVMGYRM